MSRINVLNKNVYDKIAAGEVVERPCAVVKELVENSIDARATRIEISVVGGGMKSISVSDNGCGIDADQLETAFLEHSTSKISAETDLDNIETMGFRGEALCSIAAVSRVKLSSKTEQADVAGVVELTAGKTVTVGQCARNTGTTITVEELFFNVPARKKFLKTASRETTEISNYVTRLTLTHPELEIVFSVDGKQQFYHRGNGLAEAIFTVYDAECLDNCLKVDSVFRSIKVSGYVGNPDFAKANSTFQTFSVNHRFVKDTTIGAALKNAFKPYLMSHAFAFAVLDVSLPFDAVDVNVHPSKTEVRFANPGDVYLAVYLSVKETLKKFAERKADVLGASAVAVSEQSNDTEPLVIGDDFFVEGNEKFTNVETLSPQEKYLRDKEINDRKFEKYASEMDKVKVDDYFPKETVALRQVQTDLNNVFDDEQPTFEEKKPSQVVMPEFRVIGTLFSTYVIIERGEEFLLVDQHAAHERILFDKFMAKQHNLPMQQLLVPFVFSATAQESEFLENNLSSIRDAGFEISEFGANTFRVTAVAAMFVCCDLDELVKFILTHVSDMFVDSHTIVKEKIAQHACKTAVKAGDSLTDSQIHYILDTLQQNKHFTCPHGRPVLVTVTKNELEKKFKRVL